MLENRTRKWRTISAGEFKVETLLMICLFGFGSADVILNTKSGAVRGTTSLTEDVNAFLGIPFAEPPVEELRFAKPIPKAPWSDVYNATKLPPPCAQYILGPYYFMPDVTNMSEDCLHLNVWVPKSKYSQGLRPIVIFIHGGAFSLGSASFKVYDGSKLASRGDIIVATINYRLGAFGFFLAHIEEAPGNMGMHDQIMAIKWVKDNAELFGGDPNNIVLMGESAGGVSISMHMISPLSQNLFDKAIIQSGSPIHPLLFDGNANLDKTCKSVASVTGCANETVNIKTDPRSVVDCMKRKSKEVIIEAEKTLSKTNALLFFPAVNDEILPKSIVDQFRGGEFRKDVNVLIGVNRDEGTLPLIVLAPEYFGRYGYDAIQLTKKRGIMLSRSQLSVLGQDNASEIVDFYAKSVKQPDSTGYTKMISDLVGDYSIACPSLFLADFLSLKGNTVYYYLYEFKPASSPMADWVGATHMDELQYVFGNPFHDNFTAEEIEISNRLMDRWSAFARTGNPDVPDNISWPPYNYHNRLYMNFGQEEETIRTDPNPRCQIWRKIFKAD